MRLYELEKIRIDGKDYRVDFVDPSPLMVSAIANVDYLTQTITIGKTTFQNDIESLLHEITHVINYNRLGDELTEMQVNTFGCSLAQIFLDNPDLGLTVYVESNGIEFEPEEDEKPKKKAVK